MSATPQDRPTFTDEIMAPEKFVWPKMSALDHLSMHAVSDLGDSNQPNFVDDRKLTTEEAEADVYGSLLPNGMHAPLFDFDFGAYLVPSGTEGHFHLYLDKPVSWRSYRRVLRSMVRAGLVEKGYLLAAERRGQAFLRVPWKRKGEL